MISFENDYSEGAHPKILEKLAQTNMIQEPGYGADSFTKSAIDKIRKATGLPEAEITFLVGGTQTNQVVIDTMLDDFGGVLAAETAHINMHEAGAIEFSGHKVLPLPSVEGKVDPRDVSTYLENFYRDVNHEHMVFPQMLFISYPTEYGTIYSKAELEELRSVCDRFDISLYIDGARLGYGLASDQADLTLEDIARLCDVFYIGGTKIGALCGEAVVFTKKNRPAHFDTRVKQHGALLAKGRLLGLMFDQLFTDDLYFHISRHADRMAQKMKQGFLDKGYRLFLDSPTNQQFVVMDRQKARELAQAIRFSVWEPYNKDQMVIRFVTSWASQSEQVDALLSVL